MTDYQPIAVSGRYDRKRPRAIPKIVQTAISLMIVGKVDDADCEPLDFIAAAKSVGMTPFVLRRHLEKPHVRAFLLAERRAFRAMICCANEAALRRVRDKSKNGMVTVSAVRALEELAEPNDHRANQSSPGVVIRVVNQINPPPQPLPPIIEHEPLPSATIEHFPNACSIRTEPPPSPPRRVDANGQPVFTPSRW
jgi:hypothetical protein